MVGLIAIFSLSSCAAGSSQTAQTGNHDLELIDPDMLSQDIYDALQYEWESWENLSTEQRMLSSHLPGYCEDSFLDWEECEKFLGMSISNPLEDSAWLEKGTYVGMPEGFQDAPPVEVSWYGTQDGLVEWISIQSGYRNGEMRVTLNATLYGNPAKEKSDDSGWPVELTRRSYLENQECGTPFITVESGEQFESCTAYFTEEFVLYRISVIGEPEMQSEVQETLEKVLADFGKEDHL